MIPKGNALDEEQITAILEGKRVIAPKKDIIEARNAITVYAMLENLKPLSETSLFKAQAMLMKGLVKDGGH